MALEAELYYPSLTKIYSIGTQNYLAANALKMGKIER